MAAQNAMRHLNNFDFIRMAAALSVLVSHQFALTGNMEPAVVPGWSLGGVAVFVFFSISGYLVAQSWVADPSVWRFAMRRMLRIWPGLACAIVLVAVVGGRWFRGFHGPSITGTIFSKPISTIWFS